MNKPIKKSIKEEDFIACIHEMLCGKSQSISNEMVLEEIYNKKKDQIDTDGKLSKMSRDDRINDMRVDYGQMLKNAKAAIRDCLKKHGLDFEQANDPSDKRKYVFKYPTGIDFNPYEELTKESKKFKLTQLLDLLNQSGGLFPESWLANFRLELNKELYPDDRGKLISFDTNNSLKNIELVPILFDCIKKQQVVSFLYHPFGRDKAFWVTLHPKFLKEYNNRWFVFGRSKKISKSQYAIDRIEGNIQVRGDMKFIDDGTDYAKLFENRVGVSDGTQPQKVVIKFWTKRC